MRIREEAQAAIRDVCKKRGLQYTLDFEYEKGSYTKIRIAYVKPENLLDYRHLLVAGNRWRIDAQDVVEEEAMLEIWQEGNKWEHKIAWTKALPTGDSVIGDVQADVTDALKEDKPAVKKPIYDSPVSRPGRRQNQGYKWARRRLVEGHDVEELYWEWCDKFARYNSSIPTIRWQASRPTPRY